MEYIIEIQPSSNQTVADTQNVPFGAVPTTHMFIAEYANKGWQNPRIVPFQALTLSPLALSLHYGQTVFEGMKAFKMVDGKLNIYRIEKHWERFNKSLARMCMPEVPRDLFVAALTQFVQLERNWVPEEADGSLYLRPFMIATESRIGVKISDEYLFMVVASPAYQYYANPLKIKVERQYVRAAEGGTGFAKCGGNYGGSFYPAELAKQAGYDQVLWTDSKTHEYIEESGTMNAMFYIDGTLLTPALSSSILDGVTRDSILALAKENNWKLEVRRISVEELRQAFKAGKRVEAFGAGTAAVIAPIESITIDDERFDCYTGEDAFMFQIKKHLYEIRKGLRPDTHHWNYIL